MTKLEDILFEERALYFLMGVLFMGFIFMFSHGYWIGGLLALLALILMLFAKMSSEKFEALLEEEFKKRNRNN